MSQVRFQVHRPSRKARHGFRDRLHHRVLVAATNRISTLLPRTRASELLPALYRLAGPEIGPNVWMAGGTRLALGTHIGQDSFIGMEVLLCASGGGQIRIGRHVAMGPRCYLDTGTHEIGGPTGRSGPSVGRDIEIGDGTWLGAGVIVTAGVTIGPGCVVGAGSVVTQDLPAHVVAAGNPARVLRPLPDGSG